MKKTTQHTHPRDAKWGGVRRQDRWKDHHLGPVAQPQLSAEHTLWGTGSHLTLINLDPGSIMGADQRVPLQVLGIPGAGAEERPRRRGLSEHRGLGLLNSNATPGLALARLSLSLCLKTFCLKLV